MQVRQHITYGPPPCHSGGDLVKYEVSLPAAPWDDIAQPEEQATALVNRRGSILSVLPDKWPGLKSSEVAEKMECSTSAARDMLKSMMRRGKVHKRIKPGTDRQVEWIRSTT